MEVQAIKTIAGEEIIGSDVFVDETHGVLCMTNTVVLRGVQHPQTGEVIAGFGDWPAVGALGQTYTVRLSAILLMPYEINEDLKRQYISNVTGLELPPATPKILLS